MRSECSRTGAVNGSRRRPAKRCRPLHAVSEAVSQGQDLHIAHVAVGYDTRKDTDSRLAREKLEAALRVANVAEANHGVHAESKCPRAQPSIPRLGLFNLGLCNHSGPGDHIVSLLEPGKHLDDLVNRRFVVGIDKADISPVASLIPRRSPCPFPCRPGRDVSCSCGHSEVIAQTIDGVSSSPSAATIT